MAKDPVPGWRQGNKRAAGPTSGAGAGKRDWQMVGKPQAGPKKPWSRGSKLALAVTLLSAFGIGIWAMILLLRPVSPACIIMIGASYDDNLSVPHNVFGWKNLKDLDELQGVNGLYTENGKPNFFYRCPELKDSNLNGVEIWNKEWDKLLKKDELLRFRSPIREDNIVLFLALHGAADGSGPYFFVGDERGTTPLPFAHVLKSLEDDLGGKNVLLIIEPALARANWSAGVLENTFVQEIKQEIKKSKLNRNLFILCASDERQTSWSSEEWQQTVFGHFVIEGLRGAADIGDKSGNGNYRVSVKELADYVKKNVQDWSDRNRGVKQEPLFIGDDAAAAQIEIAQVASVYQERTEDPPGFGVKLPASLKKSWENWQKLNKELTPHPSVYSPALWRRYQELLVRYEQLLRAGDPTGKADKLELRLTEMKRRIETEARCEAAEETLSLSLPMAAGLGIPLALPDKGLNERVRNIWQPLEADKRSKSLQDLMKWTAQFGDVKLSQRSAQVYRSFMDDVVKSVNEPDLIGVQGDKVERSSKAQAILEFFEGELSSPRPAEVHYLAMLLKDIVKPASPDLKFLKDSLAVRMLAERAALSVADSGGEHPYSEVIYPWIRAKIEQADAMRRPGEDLLFSSSKFDWEKSDREYLKPAQELYKKIQKDSEKFRRGLNARDRGMAELPFYALWVANQRGSTVEAHERAVDELIGKVTDLSQKIDSLNEKLSAEKNAVGALKSTSEWVEDVGKWANEVDEIRNQLGKELLGEIRRVNQDTHSHELWFDREAILAAPPPLIESQDGADNIDVRLVLLDLNLATSRELFKRLGAGNAFGGNAVKESEILRKRNVKLATAAFKPFWPDDFAAIKDEDPGKTAKVISAFMAHWPADINDALSKSRGEGNLDQAAVDLRPADFLSRGLPGAFFDDKSSRQSASQALRQLRFHNLLVKLAQRTQLDHWYPERENDTPYYAAAATKYLNVAMKLAEGETKDTTERRTKACAELVAAVTTPGFEVTEAEGRDVLYWTSETEFPVRWTIRAPDHPYAYDGKPGNDPSPPPAIAVKWREKNTSARVKGESAGEQRESVDWRKGQSRNYPDKYSLEKTNPDEPKLTEKYTVLLRGQKLPKTLGISQKLPEVVVHDFPAPEKAFVKIRMDPKFNYGAVAIALDLSGSMLDDKSKLKDGKPQYAIPDEKGVLRTRLYFALKALESTLQTIPDKTFVSLTAFMTERGSDTPKIIPIRKSAEWKSEFTAELINRIESLAASGSTQGATPMAYLLNKCAQDGFPGTGANFRGRRVILGLTDGDDNYTGDMDEQAIRPWPKWSRATQDEYNRRVSEYVTDRFRMEDLEIKLICFIDEEKNATEAKNATEQFKDALENKLRTKGHFRFQKEPKSLPRELDEALRPRLNMKLGNASQPPPGYDPKGELASKPNDNYNWLPAPPENYSINVEGSGEKTLTLKSGDMVALALKRDDENRRAVVYVRESFIDLLEANRSKYLTLPTGQTLYGKYRAVVAEQIPDADNNSLTQAAVIEATRGGDTAIQQVVPRFVWIESLPSEKAAREPTFSSRWYREYGYPGLTYRVISQDWPNAGRAPGKFNVWIADDLSRSFATERDLPLKNKGPIDVTLKNQTALIESVSLEDRDVVPKAGAAPVRKKCLVVRASHTKNHPVMILFSGERNEYGGEEHHFYDSADKYTAMFWDLKNPNLETVSVQIVFLSAMKEATGPPAEMNVSGQIVNFPRPYLKMVN